MPPTTASYGTTEVPTAKEETFNVESLAPYIAEFVGTFILVFTVGCCSITGSGIWNATAIGSVLMVMIYATGPVSGGNLNPAVSLALFLSGKIDLKKMLGYWAAQLVAGIVAGFCFCALLSPNNVGIAAKAPFTVAHAAIVEIIYTFMICFVVLNCAGSKRNNPKEDGNQFFALAIGFVIIAGGYAAGDISGACFNPAVSLGLDISSQGHYLGLTWGGFELLGGCLAAFLFRVVRPEEQMDDAEFSTYKPSLRTKCVSEFLGVFILVLTVGLNVVMGSVATAFSAAAALMCMIYSLGDVSGGHFNPAVTLAVVLSGRDKCPPREGLAYAITQLLAGVLAGCVYSVFHANGPNKDTTYSLAHEGHSVSAGGVIELVFTCVLCYIVLTVATVELPFKQRNFYFALAIGSCVTAGGFAGGAVSGGELNPAVTTGIEVANMIHTGTATPSGFTTCITFWLYELLGGAIAAFVLRLTHPQEFKGAKPLLG